MTTQMAPDCHKDLRLDDENDLARAAPRGIPGTDKVLNGVSWLRMREAVALALTVGSVIVGSALDLFDDFACLVLVSTVDPVLLGGTTGLAGLLAKRVAVVTGASSGIGRAIAIAFAEAGAHLYLVGRNAERLAQTAAVTESLVPTTALQLDLSSEGEVQRFVKRLSVQCQSLDILVHGAGVIHEASLQAGLVEQFEEQFAINVRAPYLLTQGLLPLLTATNGQIVFVNSSAGLSATRPEAGQYAATKHALKAIADATRAEVNPMGVRVLSVYLGRTATPMQEALFKQAARAYVGERLLQPEDVAAMVVSALSLASTAEVTDIMIRPTIKA